MSCLRAALAAGAQRILIFEDDILFRRFSHKTLEDAVRFMKTHSDWDLFFLGCFVESSRKTPFRSVLRVRYRCTAHAYAVHRRFAQRLVEIPWQGIAYDDLLRSMDEGHYYACYPAIGFQSNSATDNSKMLATDRYRRIMGGIRWLQRWDEFSKHHARALIVAHLAAAILIVLVVLARMGWL
jgi:GR25 family glycosyltransferase involved in LPS biosynthesis